MAAYGSKNMIKTQEMRETSLHEVSTSNGKSVCVVWEGPGALTVQESTTFSNLWPNCWRWELHCG